MLFSSRTSASCCTAARRRHTKQPPKAFGSSPMVDAMAYSVRRTPSSRARPVGWNNSFRYSLGLRYDPTRQWSLRLGTAYDETLGVPCTDQGAIMSYDFTQTVASGGALVQCQGRTWTATAGSSANEVLFTPDTPIVLPPEQRA